MLLLLRVPATTRAAHSSATHSSAARVAVHRALRDIGAAANRCVTWEQLVLFCTRLRNLTARTVSAAAQRRIEVGGP
jgi:hypothetical protein